MDVQLRYFAVLRERLGLSEETLHELQSGCSVLDIEKILIQRDAGLESVFAVCRVAVNQEFVQKDTVLRDRDEVAFIPPVAGGIDRVAFVLEEPLSLDRAFSAVRDDSFGGFCCFVGAVRNHSQGHDVMRLEYEAYRKMAEKVLQDIVAQVRQEHRPCKIMVEHRVGQLAIGDLAVVIAVGTPHRAEAFSACRAVIEELKKNVPIWKKEFDGNGGTWVGMGP